MSNIIGHCFTHSNEIGNFAKPFSRLCQRYYFLCFYIVLLFLYVAGYFPPRSSFVLHLSFCLSVSCLSVSFSLVFPETIIQQVADTELYRGASEINKPGWHYFLVNAVTRHTHHKPLQRSSEGDMFRLPKGTEKECQMEKILKRLFLREDTRRNPEPTYTVPLSF